jgi:hypothetical protein
MHIKGTGKIIPALANDLPLSFPLLLLIFLRLTSPHINAGRPVKTKKNKLDIASTNEKMAILLVLAIGCGVLDSEKL